MQIPWRFEASQLDGTPAGVIENASGRTATIGNRAPRTGSFNVRLDHPLAELILSCDCLIRVYNQYNDLQIHGQVVTAQEIGNESGGSIAVTFADPFWRLSHRLLGKSTSGYSNGTALAMVDRIAIAKDMIDVLNAEAETGIDTSGMIGTSSNTYVGPLYYSTASDRIAELAATLDGFDWTIEPMEYTSGKIGQFIAVGAMGGVNLDAAFEYGDGKLNVKSYNRPNTAENLLNSGYDLPTSWPDTTQAVIGGSSVNGTKDDASVAVRGLHEGVVPGSYTSDDLRLKGVQENVRIRRNPRQTISFEPMSELNEGVPRFDVDYHLGDVVPFRATINGSKRIDVLMRVRGVSWSLDDTSGIATPTITVVES